MKERIELIWEKECLNVEAAQDVIRTALAKFNESGPWKDWEIGVDEIPAHAQGFGSPTILVDRQDVAGHQGGCSDSCCRVYLNADGMSGVPSVEDVVNRLREPIIKR